MRRPRWASGGGGDGGGDGYSATDDRRNNHHINEVLVDGDSILNDACYDASSPKRVRRPSRKELFT